MHIEPFVCKPTAQVRHQIHLQASRFWHVPLPQKLAGKARREFREWARNRDLLWMNHKRLLSVNNGKKSLLRLLGSGDYYANFMLVVVINDVGVRGEVGIIQKLA